MPLFPRMTRPIESSMPCCWSRVSDPADAPCPTHPYPADAPCRTVGLDLQSRPIEYKDFQSATTMYCAKMARVAIKSRPFHHDLGGFVYSFCVVSLMGRWSSGYLITALRGLCPLVPCYARSRPCRDESSFFYYSVERLFYLLFLELIPQKL